MDSSFEIQLLDATALVSKAFIRFVFSLNQMVSLSFSVYTYFKKVFFSVDLVVMASYVIAFSLT